MNEDFLLFLTSRYFIQFIQIEYVLLFRLLQYFNLIIKYCK